MPRKTHQPVARADTRWFVSRLADRGITQAELAAAVGISPVLVSRAIGASAQPRDGFRSSELPAVARVLGVTVDELLMRLGYAVDPPYWLIAEEMDDDARVRPIRGEPKRLYGVAPWPRELTAIRVASERLFEWPAGTLLVYDGTVSLHIREAVRRLCVVSATKESYRRVAYVDAATNGRCDLRLFGSGRDMHDMELTAVNPVLTIQLVQ